MIKRRYYFKTVTDMMAHFCPDGQPVKEKEFQDACFQTCTAMGLTVKQKPKPDGSGMKTELLFGGEQGVLRCFCVHHDTQIQREELSDIMKEFPEVPSRRIIVMTMGTFTQGATAYAQGTGIRIIAGEQLLGLMKRHGIVQELPSRQVVQPEPEVRDLRELPKKRGYANSAKKVERPVGKSPLAGRQNVQGPRTASQRFDARTFMRQTMGKRL